MSTNGLPISNFAAAIGNSSICVPYVSGIHLFGPPAIDLVCPEAPTIMAEAETAAHKQPKPKEEPYSDATSSYWAPGWNWARWSHPELDFGDTDPEEIEKMRLGLLEVLGEDGFEKMNKHMHKENTIWRDRKMVAEGVPPPDYSRPDFLKRWKERHGGGEVGFVAFRTTLYDDEAKWNKYKERVTRFLSLPFDSVVRWHRWHEYPEITEARQKFTLHWIEDASLEGASAETLRERYQQLRTLKQLPPSMDYTMFLCASPQAVDSVLSLGDDESDFPTVESDYWRPDAPFLLVVMEAATADPHGPEEPHDPDDPNDERNWYRPVFKVPAEIVYSALWDVEDRSYVPPTRLTRSVRGSEELGGGRMPAHGDVDGLQEMWWGMGPTPQSLKRRARMRGMRA
ncbi:hypothetical protein LEL_09642 [Akanthomyces lecanii RCEF 1005]|uniref:Uncharacterized protein n=1 Tax=Akanthomyces lecanii RCEF 1005 TaxID=1081108 RepID=A0A168C7U4_CORDF|nr:hypothetical protein LEL_09642 [Akanthomyces lecanii RCEF 1005]